MELPVNLLKQFANITNDGKDSKREATAYGTVVVNNGTAYVKLDGTDSLTPVSLTMDARDGDRVLVMVKNHAATIVGNVSSPASARTAESFMKLVEEGLIVGNLDEDGKPTGTYSLIAPGTYYIVDEKGNKVASFSGNFIKLGGSDSSEISLCDGSGTIKLEDGTLLMYGENAVGLRSKGAYNTEIVCKANTESPVVAMQVYNEDGEPCSVVVKPDGIALSVPSEEMATVNGNPIVNAGNLMANGFVRGTGKIAANSAVTVEKAVAIPSGYRLAGIRQISTDHPILCHITQFKTDPATNNVSVTLENTGVSSVDITVRIEWFALRSESSQNLTEEVVEW